MLLHLQILHRKNQIRDEPHLSVRPDRGRRGDARARIHTHTLSPCGGPCPSPLPWERVVKQKRDEKEKKDEQHCTNIITTKKHSPPLQYVQVHNREKKKINKRESFYLSTLMPSGKRARDPGNEIQ